MLLVERGEIGRKAVIHEKPLNWTSQNDGYGIENFGLRLHDAEPPHACQMPVVFDPNVTSRSPPAHGLFSLCSEKPC